jgi:hypothetical protein
MHARAGVIVAAVSAPAMGSRLARLDALRQVRLLPLNYIASEKFAFCI